ncbi:LysR family transcriptional regulator [Nocardia sp. KC 131]|uniref:LysR family transcriptional regulator n=1 Tax=Nocardia arseniciresistens TaxID=3392119 RepID=UPI00398F6262
MLSPARVSQAIKKQERSVGADLFERNSRNVKPTEVGRQLRDDLRPIYRGLHESVERARLSAQGKTGELRIGAINSYELRVFWEAFRTRYPQWGLRIRHNAWTDPFEPLRDGEIDVLVTLLPVEEPDLTVGPRCISEEQRLIMSVEHVLANRDSVSMEDLGRFPTITGGTTVPEYWEDAYLPFYTPKGREVGKIVPVRRG